MLGTDGADRGADGLALVAAEIIHDHDVAGLEGRHEELPDVGEKAAAVDGAIEDARCGDAIVPQGGQEGHRRPVPVGNFGHQRRTAPIPAMGAGLDGPSENSAPICAFDGCCGRWPRRWANHCRWDWPGSSTRPGQPRCASW